MRLAAWLAGLVLWLAAAGIAVAQDGGPAGGPEVQGQAAGPQVPAEEGVPEASVGRAQYGEWQQVAERAAALSEAGRGSEFALSRLRQELVDWRDRFAAEAQANASRIATVEAQLQALGQAPAAAAEEEGSPPPSPEAPVITQRREALNAQLAKLRAPVLLAEERYAQANGLIAEIDRLIRARQARTLVERGPVPLNPRYWPVAVETLVDRLDGLTSELVAFGTVESRRQALFSALPAMLALMVVGAVLVLNARRWTRGRPGRAAERDRGLRRFGLTLLEMALKVIGVVMFSSALVLPDPGYRLTAVFEMLPGAALFPIAARWLSEQFFEPDSPVQGPLAFAPSARARARRIVLLVGWIIFFGGLFITAIETGETAPGAYAVLTLPWSLWICWLLFRFGRLLVYAPRQAREGAAGELAEAEGPGYREIMVATVGRASILAAVVAPVLAAAGYAQAEEALTVPVLLTLATLASVIVLQRLVHDLWGFATGDEEDGQNGLVPILLSFGLALLSLPVFVLIWGARPEDIVELWTRANEGLALGETRVSPSDFVWLLVVFVAGYALTRLVQSALRSTVLPRTRLDIGGRNAIVAGIGYVGIFLAALIAIVSAGLDLSSLAIVAGALSVGIGFGLQTIVSNFVAGIILLVERPISEGDWIEVGGQMGYVRKISVRSTVIETFDRTDVIVPNADLVSGRVTNYTKGNSVGRAIIPVGVRHGTDVALVERVLTEVAEANPMVILNPPPQVLFMGIEESCLKFEIRSILRDVNFILNVISETNHLIARRFAEEGIELAFPQRDLWLRNPEVFGFGRAFEPVAEVPGARRPAAPQPDNDGDADY